MKNLSLELTQLKLLTIVNCFFWKQKHTFQFSSNQEAVYEWKTQIQNKKQNQRIQKILETDIIYSNWKTTDVMYYELFKNVSAEY